MAIDYGVESIFTQSFFRVWSWVTQGYNVSCENVKQFELWLSMAELSLDHVIQAAKAARIYRVKPHRGVDN